MRRLDVEVRPQEGAFSIYVDAIRTVDRESFSVAYKIAAILSGAVAPDRSECAEVAESIRRWREAW